LPVASKIHAGQVQHLSNTVYSVAALVVEKALALAWGTSAGVGHSIYSGT